MATATSPSTSLWHAKEQIYFAQKTKQWEKDACMLRKNGE
jgi:hypothetical protein